ncbi:aminotransferase class I/II-fold pyridoxal phosphate-dependent enzyme [Kribbella sp. NBC_00889]|uniref:aminotransferase class I/II-fold pyridoxal phosphate-dependent enzyme n=1 Tax=Kribbella sp. NBC_00889 TaxID=2975974 RepID=UPI003869899F|nr:aminotransferase class I/II-fold pyridoxal phosphate-dependent enzyme [Kribbella sp. NBC_00889]
MPELQGADPDHVAYLGTTSKTLGPALRLGWMVLPPRLMGQVADARTHIDHRTEHLGQLTLADLITRHGYDRHIRRSRQRYRRRRDQLRHHLAGLRITLTGIAAGLHALAILPRTAPPRPTSKPLRRLTASPSAACRSARNCPLPARAS